jgi:monothiol bacilliredoxin
MTFRERVTFLSTPAEVDGFLQAHPSAAIFKAGTCHKTNETFQHVEALLEPRVELKLGIIRVLEARAASNHVEARTGITHESPQLILFKDGSPVFDRDNWDITPEDLEQALQEHFSGAPA